MTCSQCPTRPYVSSHPAPSHKISGAFCRNWCLDRRGLRKPSGAEQSRGPERKVWIVSNGAPEARAVTIGATDGKRTEIVKGELETGEGVIVDSETRP